MILSIKHIAQLVLLSMLISCSSALPHPSEPKGKITPVNPSQVYLSELKISYLNRL